MTAKLDHALALAGMGLRVFPIQPNGKKPIIKNWDTLATTQPETINRWWSEHEDANIGLATGRGIVVLDYDMKPGQKGQQSLDMHDMLGLPLDGYNVTTPTGGLHLYFRSGKPVRNSASKVAQNVDVRGDGGYVVAPGSTIDGKTYEATLGALLDLPEWMAELATAHRTESTVSAKTSLVDLDKPSNIEAAIRWLEDEAPESIKGMGGDTTAYKVACRVRDFGVSKDKCLDLLLDHWNETKALSGGPWHPEKLAVKVENAYAYATLPIGINDAQGELGDVSSELSSLETTNKTAPNRLFAISAAEAAECALEQSGEPLIEGMLDRGAFAVIFGQSNQGKTFVMLDKALHVAAGRPWNGRYVKEGLVAYVSAEGGTQIYKRAAALKKHYGFNRDLPFEIIPCPVNLLDAKKGDMKDLVSLIRDLERKHSRPLEMLVIDTMQRAMAGGDENSSADVGRLLTNLDKLREVTKAQLSLVHHSGKDQARGARGWSGVTAATDTELEIADGKIITRKQRDMEKEEPIAFRLKTIELGTNSKGKRVTSSVIEVMAAPEFDTTKSPIQENLLEALSEMRHNAPERDIVTNSDINSFLKTWQKRVYNNLLNTTEVSRELCRLVSLSGLKNPKRGQWDISELYSSIQDV